MKTRLVMAALGAALLLAGGSAAGAGSDAKSRNEAALINTQLGMTYMRQGNLQAAREKIEKALSQNPKTAQTQMAAGFLYDRLGEDRKASGHFDQAVRLANGDPDVLNNAAVYYCRKGDKKVGEKYFLQAAQSPLYRTPEVAYTNAGRCARADGRSAEAEQYFRKALVFNAKQPDALLQLADLYQETGKSTQARPFLERYLEAAPASASALWLGYRIEKSAGDLSAANQYAERMKMEFPSAPETGQLLEAEGGTQ
jgi:type IV pilus assembly protein PilF